MNSLAKWLAPARFPQAPLPLVRLLVAVGGIGFAIWGIEALTGSALVGLVAMLLGLGLHANLNRLQARRQPEYARYPLRPDLREIPGLVLWMVAGVAVLVVGAILTFPLSIGLWGYLACALGSELGEWTSVLVRRATAGAAAGEPPVRDQVDPQSAEGQTALLVMIFAIAFIFAILRAVGL